GDGMFIVQDGTLDYYTRAGNFYLDDNGQIVNSEGLYLMGYSSVSSAGTHLVSADIEIVLGEDNSVREVILINEQGNRTPVEFEDIEADDGDDIVIELEDGRIVNIS